MNKRPLILLHGLWNTPYLFSRFISNFDQSNIPIFVPFLPHGIGTIQLYTLANKLNDLIYKNFGSEVNIDLLGFSMGGLIGRIWLQEFGGYRRTNRFFSVGSPHFGTYTAQLVPRCLLPGIADMKRGSRLIKKLNSDILPLRNVYCVSYFCKWDLMVFPGWQAALPIGLRKELPVLTHKQLIRDKKALTVLVKDILSDCSLVLNA